MSDHTRGSQTTDGTTQCIEEVLVVDLEVVHTGGSSGVVIIVNIVLENPFSASSLSARHTLLKGNAFSPAHTDCGYSRQIS